MPRIDIADAHDIPDLFAVWQASVLATHDFLAPADYDSLVPLVAQALRTFTPLHCVRDATGRPLAFMGVAGDTIEMLFVDPRHRGQGIGQALVAFALGELGATRVDVNEQNAQALGFYRRMGFDTSGRSAQDPFGKPYPILHLALTAPVRSSRSAADLPE